VTIDIVGEIVVERARQDVKWGSQRAHPGLLWNAILNEEVGECARALLERDYDGLREELIQVAAVAVAWVESLDSTDGGRR